MEEKDLFSLFWSDHAIKYTKDRMFQEITQEEVMLYKNLLTVINH